MTRSLGTAVENNFTGGLVTEATALNFPENAVTDIENCTISKTGAVARRPGFDYETGAQVYVTQLSNAASSMFLWRNMGGQGDLVIIVVQVGNLLHFYRASNSALSSQKMVQIVDLNAYRVADSVAPDQVECQYAFGRGFLMVANTAIRPIRIKYNPAAGDTTSTFTVTPTDILVRDTDGVVDGTAVDQRLIGSDTSPTHYYNLYNQGWPPDKIATFKSTLGVLPSNADVWWLLKDAYGNFKPGPIESQVTVKDKTVTVYGDVRANAVYRGNTPAPKGHFILNGLLGGRPNISGIIGLPPDTLSGVQPGTVSFFSGRVFYAGISAQGFTDKIFFSQIVEKEDQVGKCYQENDPTSENLFSLLASDGGVIVVPEAGQILKLFSMSGALLVFATNGVWTITGSTGIGFSATDYTVSKVSSVNCVSASAFVDVEGFPAFWNEDGIYMVSPSKVSGVDVQSMTENKIKAMYKAIPLQSKKTAKGYYNPLDKTVQWLYRSTNPDTLDQTYDYDSVLLFNTLISAFYPWQISRPAGTRVSGIVATFGSENRTVANPVTTTAAQPVTANAGDAVTTSIASVVPVTFSYKYLVFNTNGMTFADLKLGVPADFGTVFTSYFVTGYRLRGEGSRTAQVDYLTVYVTHQVGAGLTVQSLWDYTTSGSSGRWSGKQIVSTGFGLKAYGFRKLKIRGHGKAVQFKFQSIADKPFEVVGWASVDSVNGAA